jgi:flagellin-like protein
MSRAFSSRRAISPLIATVLLIVVVVGIGAVITGIVRDYVAGSKETVSSKDEMMSCSRDVVVEVLEIDKVPQVCSGSGYVDIVLENTGGADVDDMQLVVIGDSGIYTNDSVSGGDPFNMGETQEFNGTFDPASVGVVEQVKFVPKLKKSGKAGYNFCFDVAVTYEGLENC